MLRIKDSNARHQQLVCPFELKSSVDSTGTFSGYGSVFGNVDLGDDIVERGAFEKIHYTRDNKVRLLWQHDMRQPVGKAAVKQDDVGLFVDGTFLLDIPKGREAYALVKSGIVDGMSIGYDILPDGSEMTNAGKRKLKRLELWEVSLVTFGMNPLAKVEQVKAAQDIKTKRQFEEFLRTNGFSEAAARSIAAVGFKEQQPPNPREVDGVKQLLDVVRSFDLKSSTPRDVAGGAGKMLDALRNL